MTVGVFLNSLRRGRDDSILNDISTTRCAAKKALMILFRRRHGGGDVGVVLVPS